MEILRWRYLYFLDFIFHWITSDGSRGSCTDMRTSNLFYENPTSIQQEARNKIGETEQDAHNDHDQQNQASQLACLRPCGPGYLAKFAIVSRKNDWIALGFLPLSFSARWTP